MKVISKEEWFQLEKPIGEPDVKYNGNFYRIERVLYPNDTVIWFGIETNWKLYNGEWTKLNKEHSWESCSQPIYEKLYKDV